MSLYQIVRTVFDGPFATLWPMLVAPPLAAVVCDRTARALDPAGEDRRLPAALAVTPGLILLSLTFVPIRDLATGASPLSLEGWLLWLAPLFLAGACLLWACARLALRQWKVAQVFALARAPTPELAALAGSLGVRARLVGHAGIDCFVAGLVRPTVFVSLGAVQALDPLELRAALAHEAAHVRGRDGQLIALLSFFCDLVPLPWPAPLAAFREACETRADRLAAESAGAVHLASALVAAAAGARLRPAHALGLGGPQLLRVRLQRLLHGPAAADATPRRRIGPALGLLALFTLAGLPIAQARMICTDHVKGRLARFECPYHAAQLAAARAARPRIRVAATAA